MNKRIIIFGTIGIATILIAIVLIESLVINFENDDDKDGLSRFVGRWTAVVRPLPIEASYLFKEDGTFTYRVSYSSHVEQEDEIKNGTFTIENGNLILLFENSEEQVFRYIFSKNDKYVTLLDESFDVEKDPNILQFTWMK